MIGVGLDIGGETGTFAARMRERNAASMRERNATIITTFMNLDGFRKLHRLHGSLCVLAFLRDSRSLKHSRYRAFDAYS